VPTTPYFEELVTTVLTSPAITLYGFYCHAGNSYASTNSDQVSSFLSAEVETVNIAAGIALSVMTGLPNVGSRHTPFVLSVGSTPTAHAATTETRNQLSSLLNGQLELHAGILFCFRLGLEKLSLYRKEIILCLIYSN
jgi:D-serine deaminase-like pyridoxal phosphate-dependent protein